jgi:hypothetical protein
MTQDIVEARGRKVQAAMEVLRLRCSNAKASIEALDEAGKKIISIMDVVDFREPQRFHKPILQGPVCASTRPLARLEFAHRISMFSSASARPNCVMPCPPLASGLLMRNTECLSE